ncbi:MAG: MBL fold metallo-hydrolase [Acidobacteria bacterium]|nr:MBL fold metallo-hydrolase [Acidobacteriota bacterium]
MTRSRKKGRMPSGAFLIALVFAFAFSFYQSCKRESPETPQPAPPGEVVTEGRLVVYALDVGQGDGLLVITPERKTVLIDAGTPQASEAITSALARYGVQSLDLVIASHPHADHIGSMKRVIDNFPVRNFLDSGQTHTSATYERMLKAIQDKKVRFLKARSGQTFDLDSGVKIEVLNPSEKLITEIRSGGSVLNANSVVVRLSYGDFAMIFTGDAEFETEADMMKRGVTLRAQVLKVGHHGSRHATSGRFLDTVAPRAAIISCGGDNKYGHPSPQVLDRLREKNIQLYRTDLHGEIIISSDGKSFDIRPTREADLAAVWKGRTATQSE